MQHTSIGKRIGLALALPIVALVFMSLWMVFSYHRTADDAGDVRKMTAFAPTVSALIHELQQERGLSAAFLQSGGTTFAERLTGHYPKTDAQLATYLESIKDINFAKFDARPVEQITRIQSQLDQLSQWRQAVRTHKISPEEITENYTLTIDRLIAAVKTLQLLRTSSDLSNAISAYVNLMQAKELNGIERAVGSVRFVADGGNADFNFARKIRLLQLIDQQKLYLDQFRFFASPEHITLLEQALASPEAMEVARMEHIATSDAGREQAATVDAAHWFDTITQKINQLKAVEDRLASNLTAQATTMEQSARTVARMVSLLILLILAITISFAATIARGIIYPIVRMTGAMQKLAMQDESVAITDHQRGDEIGDMARATIVFRENILRITQAEERSKSEAFLRLHHKALSSIAQGVLITGEGKKITFANEAFQHITGYSEAEILGKRPGLLYGPDTDDTVRTELRAATSAGEKLTRNILGYRKSGEAYWSEVSVTPVLDSEGHLTHVVSVMRDITESRRVEQEIRIAATAIESLHGMMVTDAHGAILRVNRAFTEMTGYAAEEVVGKSPAMFKSGRHDQAFYAAMWQQLESTGAWYGEVWDRRKNGEIFPKWQSISAVRGADGKISHYVAAFSDISEHKKAEEQIRSLAFYDPLTTLPNRRLLLDRLQQAIALSERIGRCGALLFIDLDQFKTLNDTLGHDVGDQLLIEVAKRLHGSLRACDTAARLGGDEFVVMLEDLSENPEEAAAQAKIVGEKILATLNRAYQLTDHVYHNTPSIGITLFQGTQTSIEELLKQADLAMYQSKASGRNTMRFFDPKMQAVVTHRAQLESDLREGLEKNEFLLHFQAQVDGDGRLLGAEALVRWQHPVRGLVAPMEFIPLAEETGLILPLGQWVLETACAQLSVWSDHPETADLTMAVNVSARQFHQPDFVSQVFSALESAGANPCKLKLELTESLLLDDFEDTIAKMHALKAKGVCFALDDFGTGYSSLAYLKRLPLDQLKIDRSFVRDVLTDANDAVIASTIVNLAHSLGLTVIAEGVEMQGQLDFLADKGCLAYQGYFFGQPGVVESLRNELPGGG
jgi:diguanylate cyclase (GGDEF)-like protein/PAS domain S-box-containing protein